MYSGDYTYIWQAGDWPSWRDDDLAALARSLADASRMQGLLMGRLAGAGMDFSADTSYSPHIVR